jgi:hypothetical protein
MCADYDDVPSSKDQFDLSTYDADDDSGSPSPSSSRVIEKEYLVDVHWSGERAMREAQRLESARNLALVEFRARKLSSRQPSAGPPAPSLPRMCFPGLGAPGEPVTPHIGALLGMLEGGRMALDGRVAPTLSNNIESCICNLCRCRCQLWFLYVCVSVYVCMCFCVCMRVCMFLSCLCL